MLQLRQHLAIIILLTAFISTVHGATLQVPLEFPNIQAGIDAAAVGDTVLLDPGLYFGQGNRDLDYHGKDITVRSRDNDPATCIITCQGSESAPHQGVIFQSGETLQARLEGVTISEAYVNFDNLLSGGGITCLNGSSPTISNCRIFNNYCYGGSGGIYALGSSPIIENCWIHHNSSDYSAGGVGFFGFSEITMTGCLITDNGFTDESCLAGGVALGSEGIFYLYNCTIANNNGIGLNFTNNAVINRCTIVGNEYGVYVWEQGFHSIENSLIAYNDYSFYVDSFPTDLFCCNLFGNTNGDWPDLIFDQQGINGNISADPLLCDPDNWNYRVAAGSPCLDGICGQIGAWGLGDCSDDLSPVPDLNPLASGLQGNYPNPFNPSTTIRFNLEEESPVSLQIFDVAGKLVRTLIDNEIQSAGPGSAVWDGRNLDGRPAAAGIYLNVLTTSQSRDTGRMALIK